MTDEDLIIPEDHVWPAPQAVGSKTFHPPPIDGTLKLHEMVDYNRVHSPEHPVWEYPKLDGSGPETISWKEYGEAMHRAAHIVDAFARTQNGKRSVITMISSVNQPTFMALELGVFLSGHIIFLISPRNSLPAIIHLLQKTKTTHLIVDVENANFHKLAKDSSEAIAKETGSAIPILATPQFTDLYGVPFVPFEPKIRVGLRDVAAILHSSGSTAFPKPIDTSHVMLLEFSRLFWWGDTDMCGKRENGMVLPSFHNYALVQLLSKTIPSGKINCTYNPTLPTRIPTATEALKDIVASNTYTLLMVPAFLSEWSRDPAAIAQLSKFKAIFTGGAPTSKEVGAALRAGGVKLVNLYGSTECGISSRLLITNNLGNDWECMEKVGAMKWHLADQGDGTFELHVMRHRFSNPGVINFSLPDGSLWRIIGRKDEQILLANGEKTNPLPSEGIINKDDLVHDSMMFGEGKTQNGILVVPRPPMKVDVSNEAEVSAFRNAIWPSVEEANNVAPQHSRIFKEMILISTPEKPFDYTPKMSLRRKVVLAAYAEEIEAAYAAKTASALKIAPSSSWVDPADARDFVRRAVTAVLRSGENLSDDDDLFLHGCDSLQATYIRNTILNALGESSIDTAKVPMNFVYLRPNITSLGIYVSQVASNLAAVGTPKDIIDHMETFIAKYSEGFVEHKTASSSASTSNVVLLTGSTGALGSYLLAKLLQDDLVSKVYAVNRQSSSSSLADRQKEAFVKRGLVVELLASSKLHLVEADISSLNAGLSSELYDEIRSSVTTIIHNAWRLDFNLTLAQFEPQVASVRHLIDLALSSPLERPPLFLFTSSVGAVSSWTGSGSVPEAHLEDLASAVGNGYGTSKAVGEKILENASRSTPLQTISVRIGQLCGSAINGAWNETDWVPIMLQSAEHVRCLPSLHQIVTWTPIDQAANILLDFCSSSSAVPNDAVMHIVHPRPTSWNTLLEVFAKSQGVPLVPYSDWLAKVAASDEKNPAHKLLEFFQKGAPTESSKGREATGIAPFATVKSQAASKALAALEPLNAKDAESWLSFWRGVGAAK
ncbi:hypothetical protein FB451DRAFT_255063 [Mycena latifolia]|nr:hypothetical protein FB451DRAFT_255063 [Mycena latifolia]